MNAALRLTVVTVALIACSAFPATAPLDCLGQSFYSPKTVIEWELRTNPLPPTVRIQRIVSTTFAPQVVSNLVDVAGFSETNRVYSDFLGQKIQKDTFAYRSADEGSSLCVIPRAGYVDLYIPQKTTLMPEHVPDRERAIQLATNLLHVLRIPQSEFSSDERGLPRGWFYPGTTTHFGKQGEPITRPSSMGIEFRRKFDGIPCYAERLHAQFEAEEQLTQMELGWHGVQPSPPYAVAILPQIAAWITEGRARVQSFDVAGPGGRRLQPKAIKKLIIREIVPHYTGPTYHAPNKFDEKTASAFYPYAVLTAEAKLGPDDNELIFLFVPVTAEALMKPSRKVEKYGFAIYPSARYQRQRRGEAERR